MARLLHATLLPLLDILARKQQSHTSIALVCVAVACMIYMRICSVDDQ